MIKKIRFSYVNFCILFFLSRLCVLFDSAVFAIAPQANSSGVYICKSIVNYLRHGNFICKSEVIYLTYEHRIEIPVEFTYVNQ